MCSSDLELRSELLGSRINCGWRSPKALEQFMGLNELIAEIDGSIPVLRWGAVPVLFHTETFLKEALQTMFEAGLPAIIYEELTGEDYHPVDGARHVGKWF